MFNMYQCIIFIFMVLFNTASSDQMLVQTTQGPVVGYQNDESGLFEFYGIPYATVPTGNDKFKAPLPPEIRNYTLEATNYNIYCPQNEDTLPGLYEEDCLVLNIFVPSGAENYPVLVYIHGGAFAAGYGNMFIPEYLAQSGIITITFNYRLGAHGFLCLRTETAPGNTGLKDQLAALRWINENIAAFGGNAKDITLAGFSAGAAAAEILMLSHTNVDLFHKIILDSGSGVASFAFKDDPIEFAKQFAQSLGANSSQVANIEQLEEFYLSLSFEKMFSNNNLEDGVYIGFSPCMENNTISEEYIIDLNPLDILRNGSYTKLPILTGYTNGEGLIYYAYKDKWLPGMSTNMQPYFPPNFHLKAKEKEKDVAKQLASKYFPNGFSHANISQEFVDYFTDSLIMFWTLLSARLHADYSENVFLYEFTFSGALDEYKHPKLGAGHCAQTAYVLQSTQEDNLSDEDIIVRNLMITLWSNFIKTGNPNQPQNETWKHLNNTHMNYVKIGDKLVEETWARKEYMEFWEQIWESKWNEKESEPGTGSGNIVLPGFITIIITSFIILYLNKIISHQ